MPPKKNKSIAWKKQKRRYKPKKLATATAATATAATATAATEMAATTMAASARRKTDAPRPAPSVATETRKRKSDRITMIELEAMLQEPTFKTLISDLISKQKAFKEAPPATALLTALLSAASSANAAPLPPM